MISDAKKHKQADTKKAELVELKNKSSYLITQCKKTVEENKEVLSKDQIKDINSKVETLEKQVGTDDAEGINKRYEELNTLLGEISNSMHSQQTSDVQEEPSNDENSVDAEYEVVDDKSTENVDDK